MIRLATEADLDTVMDLIGRAVRLMRAEGIGQWGDDYPARPDFAADIAEAELFLDADGEDPRTIRGVVCVNRAEPEEYRPVAWSKAGPATVIHRLAVNPDFRRKGVARGLFLFAEEEALRNGTRYVRSDTYSRNARMNALFLGMGYRAVGDIRFKGRVDVFHCYDKVLDRPPG